MKILKNNKGQAMVEFVACLALFVTLLLGLSTITRMYEIKFRTLMAARYAAWGEEENGVKEMFFSTQGYPNKNINVEIKKVHAQVRDGDSEDSGGITEEIFSLVGAGIGKLAGNTTAVVTYTYSDSFITSNLGIDPPEIKSECTVARNSWKGSVLLALFRALF